MQVNQKVKVIEPAQNLSMPQYLYAGKKGVVTEIGTGFIYVAFSGDDAKDGAATTGGVPFRRNELFFYLS